MQYSYRSRAQWVASKLLAMVVPAARARRYQAVGPHMVAAMKLGPTRSQSSLLVSLCCKSRLCHANRHKQAPRRFESRKGSHPHPQRWIPKEPQSSNPELLQPHPAVHAFHMKMPRCHGGSILQKPETHSMTPLSRETLSD